MSQGGQSRDEEVVLRGPDFSRGGGILPAIAQDAATGEVLMLAYMNEESFAETLASGRAVYFSRSRNRLWRKGEESGHYQIVKEICIDCDNDAILLKVNKSVERRVTQVTDPASIGF